MVTTNQNTFTPRFTKKELIKMKRQQHRQRSKSSTKTVVKGFTGYRKVATKLPWRGVYNKKTNMMEPFRNGWESKNGFYIHPINNTPMWYCTSPPPDVTHYVWESTAAIANIKPVCHAISSVS